VIVSNILFQIENKEKFIEEAGRILKPGGKVLLVDWSDSSSLGPQRGMVILKSQARAMFERKGFVFEHDIDAGVHHYGMILEKK
jgi:ubiquinone/menaquinone biosynthesis C-methylase UbiE